MRTLVLVHPCANSGDFPRRAGASSATALVFQAFGRASDSGPTLAEELLYMRTQALALLFAASLLPACQFETSTWSTDDESPSRTPETASTPTPPPPASATPTVAQPKPAAGNEGAFAEVVSVYPRDRFNNRWLCTGTLVAKDIVVTAAHCLDSDMVSWEVVAPAAAGQPRVKASRPAVFGGSYEEVANPDVGILRLDTPIVVSTYASVTNVTADVEAGVAVGGSAIVRTSYDTMTKWEATQSMPVTSAVELGYEHGFAVPLFSKGGDSGAGLFLVENGKPTHKLIGVARQPEPARELDHFTRIDDAFVAWFATATATR